MTRLTRILSAALSIAAIAAPVAVAQPADTWADLYAVGPINALGADVSAPDQQAPAITRQDLRSPDQQLPAVSGQDLRSPDAADTSVPPAESSPVPAADGTGAPWSIIGLGLAGICLALAGAAVSAGRIRRRTVAA
jgi:hypothetical protein